MNAALDLAALRSQLAAYMQDTRLLQLTTSLGADALLVESVSGSEGLSEGFRFIVTALSPNAQIDTRQLIGQTALLQLLTQRSRSDLRPVHGHITAVEAISADGGFARYRLTIEPWLSFLRYNRDSYVWQNKSALDVVQEIFGDYNGKGALVPAWRLDLADPGQYPVREVCTQFEESDFDFIERLLAEEGLFYWFEHTGDPGDATLGSHTLVIADHNEAFKANVQSTIPFQHASAVEQMDSISAWQAEQHITTNTVSLGSWNERQVSLIEARRDSAQHSADIPSLTARDYPGIRYFDSTGQAERHARLHLESIEARQALWRGEGTVRTLSPGTTFSVSGNADTYVVVRVTHQARNNLSSDARSLIEGIFANELGSSTAEPDAPLYANRFTALRTTTPWRPPLPVKPTFVGLQTATVVGVSGQDLSTERDHRVKVQMHWQRGSRSHSRLAHPHGNDNAPGNETAYVWVRVATIAAGPNWGSGFIPRIGQEVVLDYIEGDIDRPVVTGSLYNGRGQEDVQGNQVTQGAGAATGNAPAWFAGNGHNAVLSGFKTQEIGSSQDGTGGYNQLVLDDTTAQVGARLQTTQHQTQLNLGHLKRQQDNQRIASHGHGGELTTEAYGAIRAGQGLLLSADVRANAAAAQMDAQEAQSQLQQALELQTSLAENAQRQHALVGPSLHQERHRQPEKALQETLQSLAHTENGIGSPSGGGAGTVPAFGRPELVMSAPAGIALLTPNDMHLAATSITSTANLDVGMTAGRHLTVNAKAGISLYTDGDAKATRKEQGDAGIKLHAAQGKLAVQAHSGAIRIAADGDASITSTTATVEVAAKEHVLLTAGGAYLKIEGGNIQIHAPGKVAFKAGLKTLEGPASLNVAMPSLPKSTPIPEANLFSQQIDFSHLANNDAPGFNTSRIPYYVIREDGTLLAQGMTTKDGMTERIFADKGGPIRVAFEGGEWTVEERYEEDEEDADNSAEG